MTALSSPQWPTDQLVAALRDLHSIAANEAADQLSALAAALDQYEKDHNFSAASKCVSAIAEAVRR